MKTIKLLAAFVVLAFAGTAFGADISLTPADCNVGVNCWTISGDPSNPTVSEIEALVGATGLARLYKQDVGGPETGGFAGNYTTTFANTSTDPEDARITWDGGDSIDCSDGCYLVVKDGNADPNTYIFDISGWDGTSDIILTDFWIGRGAISHVEILGGGGSNNVPEPGTLALLGIGLFGMGIMRRRVI